MYNITIKFLPLGGKIMKKLLLSILAVMMVFSFAACGGEEATETADDGARVIKVSSMTGYQPYAYIDEDDTVKGFEVAVVTEAVSRMENTTVEFTALPWESLMPSLESGKCDVVSCQLWRTEERVEKYYMATVPYFECGGRICVAAGTEGIETLEDLHGKTVGTTVGDAYTTFLEEYNEANGNPINLQYYQEDISTVLQDIVNGRIDATINEPNMMMNRAEIMGIDAEVKVVGDLLESGFTYLAFAKTDAGLALREEFDAIYLEMIEDGTMAELSKEYFAGEDYSQNLLNGIIEE